MYPAFVEFVEKVAQQCQETRTAELLLVDSVKIFPDSELMPDFVLTPKQETASPSSGLSMVPVGQKAYVTLKEAHSGRAKTVSGNMSRQLAYADAKCSGMTGKLASDQILGKGRTSIIPQESGWA